MKTYTREQIRQHLTQPIVKRGNTYTDAKPSLHSISVIIRELNEKIGLLGNNFNRPTPKAIQQLGIKTFSVVGGRVPKPYIAVIQYVIDNSNFAYLNGNLSEWLVADDYYHMKAIIEIYNRQHEQQTFISEGFDDNGDYIIQTVD